MPRVTWTIDGDDRPLRRKLSNLDRLAGKTGSKLNNLSSRGSVANGGRPSGFGGGGLFGAVGGLGRVAGIAAIGTASLAAVGGLAKLGGELETTRIQFATFLGSAERGNAMLKDLAQFANFTPFSNDQVNKAARTLLSFGFAGEEVIPTLKTLGDISAGTGKDLSELGVIFGQIKSTGKLMGQDLLQLINAGFNPLQQMSIDTGKSVSDLKEEMSKGLISFDQVNEAFKSATSEGGLFFNLTEKLSKSFEGKLSTALGKGRYLLQQIGEKSLPHVNQLLDGAIGLLDRFAEKQEKKSTAIRKDINFSNALFDALKRNNIQLSEKRILIDKINQRYGDRLDNLLTEKSTIEDITTAQNNLTASLKNQLAIQLKQEAQKELLAKKARLSARLTEIELQKAGLQALKGVDDQKTRSEIAKAFGLPQSTKPALARAASSLKKSESLVRQSLSKIEAGIARSDEAFKKTFGDLSGDTGSGAGPAGGSRTKTSTTRGSSSSSISGGARGVQNFTINIDNLVENIVFDRSKEFTEEELQVSVQRALTAAVNDVQRQSSQ